jgi:hypothetical protein
MKIQKCHSKIFSKTTLGGLIAATWAALMNFGMDGYVQGPMLQKFLRP